ncbi:MAG: Gx transporter family protein [Clostridiaceae bacterium]|nr:Gx transporter family protein [Clostridiaceae bacterium]
MKKIALNGLLVSLALVLAFMERFIPLDLLVPVPGVKLGLANVVTMFALFFLDVPSAIVITVLRCVLASFMFGGMTSLFYSLAGAFLALITMMVLKLGYDRIFSIVGISIGGAAAHNTGQIIMASIMMRNSAVFAYLPFLLLTGMATGIITSIVTMYLFSFYEKTIK